MALFRRPVSRASLTSAASRIIDPSAPNARSQSPDAAYLYSLYRELGPIHAACQTKFLAASKIEYFPARRIEPGADPERVDDGPAVEAYNRLRGPQGEFPDFIARMAMHWEIPGEGYLVQESDTGEEEWAVWSPVEYDRGRSKMGRPLRVPDEAPDIAEGKFVMRSWRQDPERREMPDSPLRAIQRECEQYVYLQGMISAIAQSRLMAGIIKVPAGLSFPPLANGDPSPPFFDVFYEAMEATQTNPHSATRLVPIAVEGDGETLQHLDFLDMARDLPEWVPDLMERVLRQMAVGMDLPPEQMTGLGDMNHWGAWLADDSLRLNFVDPLILNVLDSFSRGYLLPYLQEAQVPDPEKYLFWRDYGDLTSKVISPDHAIALAEMTPPAISHAALRRIIGFTEDDAPEEGETSTPAPVVPFPAAPDNVVPGPPDSIVAAGQKVGLGQIDHRLYAQISEAAQAALDRTLEKAGQKIRSHAVGDPRRPAKHPTLAAQINGVPNGQVGLTVGPSVKATLQLTDSDLVPEGSFDALGRRVEKILEAGQDETFQTVTEITGSEPDRDVEQESKWRTLAVQALLSGLGLLALRKLFTPDLEEDPAKTGEIEATQIPAPLIFDTLTIAGGGEPGFNPEAARGLANGEQAQKWIVEAGFSVREREWSIGAPAKPFEPHRSLRGTRFTECSDPSLATPPTAGWLGVSFMSPGDHRGCQCVAELVVEDTRDLFPPLAAGGVHE